MGLPCLLSWSLGGCVLAKPAVDLWAANSGAEGFARVGAPASAATAEFQAQRVMLAGAVNETLSFRFAVRARELPVERPALRVTPFVSSAGSIEPSVVQVFRMHRVEAGVFPGWHIRSIPPAQREALPPDVLVPARAPRGGLPAALAPTETYYFWADIAIPKGTRDGEYRGRVELTSGDSAVAGVDVSLTVWPFVLPDESDVSVIAELDYRELLLHHAAQYGRGAAAGTDAREPKRGVPIEPQSTAVLRSTVQLLQKHRLTPVVPTLSPGAKVAADGGLAVDWEPYDALVEPWLDGRGFFNRVALRYWSMPLPSTLLKVGQDSAASPSGHGPWSREYLAECANHFREKGWLDRAFSYTADEPPYAISFEEALRRAQVVRSSAPELPNLITTSIQEAQAHSLVPLLDIITPVVNWMDGAAPPYLGDQRSLYDDFLALPRRKLWMYQSCMSHGCTGPSPTNRPGSAWPVYVVDASAMRNRAMQWIDFRERVSGELYYETAEAITTAWTDVFRYNGNGNGTFFYAGTPAKIGGNTDVPVASIRLKQIRLGIQDYEWLKMVSDAGDPAFARDVAMSVFPSAYEVGDDGTVLERARERLISRLLELNAPPPPPDGGSNPDPADGGFPPPPEGEPAVGCSATGTAPMLLGLLTLLGLGRPLVLARARRSADPRR